MFELDGASEMVKLKVPVVEFPALSVTPIVNEKRLLATLVGVPLITPLDEFSVNPAGNDPDFTDHVYGGLPPLAARVSEYATPTVPEGSGVAVVIVKPEALVGIVNVKALEVPPPGAGFNTVT